MSETRKSLPHEATAMHLVDKEISGNAAIREFVAGITGYEAERFEQILQHLGYTMFMNGLSRPVGQRELSVKHQGMALAHEADLFLQGAAEISDYYEECSVEYEGNEEDEE
jgi:hypothetical protein